MALSEDVSKAIGELKAALDGSEYGFYGTMQLIRALTELSEGPHHHTVPVPAFAALAKLVAAVHASKPDATTADPQSEALRRRPDQEPR